MNRPSLPLSLDRPDLRRAFIRQLQGLVWINKLTQAIVGGILPIVEGVFVNLATGAANSDTARPFWIVTGVVGTIHFCLLVIVLLFEQPLPQFLVEFDGLASEIESARRQILQGEDFGTQNALFIDTFAFCSVVAELSLVAVNEDLRSPNTVKDSAFYDKIMDPWVDGRKNLFWFSNADDPYYNFALYFYDPTDQKLKKTWRKHGASISPKNREWSPGNGHVGVCYSTNSTQFCDSTLVEKLTDPTSRRTEDSTYYRSF
jgi:hypothetical protein